MTTPPTSIGRYQVLGELAIGGMSEIWLGRLVGPGGFERPVVIKRILPHLARQQAFVQMFLDEARVVARIRHPNVVQVQELTSSDDELFLVMEYLEGESVAGLMRRVRSRLETFDPHLAAFIIAEACDGLHAAHEVTDEQGVFQHVVHRDISPQNVFVTYDGHVKVIDFGVASAADRMTRTETGQVKGKFAYMSPEQCQGHPLDRRSDLFSMGIVLYELSTGRRLFKRRTHLEEMRAICLEPVVPPSRVVDGYPRELERVCMRALAADATERHETAQSMRRDLLDALSVLGKGEMRSDLADVMALLFEDRVEEKRDLLREVERGAAPANIPAGEVDDAVNVPSVPGDLVAETVAARSVTNKAKKPPVKLMMAVVGVLAASLVGVVVWRSSSAPRSQPSFPTLAPHAISSSSHDLVATQPSPPPSVSVHVSSRPPGASVVLEGREVGNTPHDFVVPRAAGSMEFVVEREGFRPASRSFVPDRDQSFVLELRPRRSTRPPRAKPPPVATPTKTGFRRWQ